MIQSNGFRFRVVLMTDRPTGASEILLQALPNKTKPNQTRQSTTYVGLDGATQRSAKVVPRKKLPGRLTCQNSGERGRGSDINPDGVTIGEVRVLIRSMRPWMDASGQRLCSGLSELLDHFLRTGYHQWSHVYGWNWTKRQ
jgi:hypothetical protein